MKRIAVLITCYNRVGTTLKCLRRLFAQKVPEGYSLDVWLVDDASPDKTGEKVKVAYPHVNVIRGTGKLFWCRGMRLAWEKAAGAKDYDGYLWLNDDVMLNDGAMVSLLLGAESRPGAIIAGAVSEPETGSVCYGAKNANGVISPNGTLQKAERGLNGNVLFVPKSAYMTIGMIDGAYLHGFGDYDYGKMAAKVGVEMFVSSETVGECCFNKGKSGKTAQLAFVDRWRLLFSPLGFPLSDTWHYHVKFDGYLRAVVSCLHVAYLVLCGKR